MDLKSQTIMLPARLDLAEVDTLVDTLLALDPATNVTLDAQDVSHFGGICAQAIIAGARRSCASGGSYSLQNLNERARGQLAVMGLNESILTEAML